MSNNLTNHLRELFDMLKSEHPNNENRNAVIESAFDLYYTQTVKDQIRCEYRDNQKEE